MDEQNINKKEQYDQQKGVELTVLRRKKMRRRITFWLVVLVVLIGSVWGLAKVASRMPENSPVGAMDKVSGDDWVKGNPAATNILIEYGDFQCPACRAYFPLVEQLVKEKGDRLQFIYRHFPLPQHKNAKPAAYASEAAGVQGKFWEMYQLIYEGQNNWKDVRDAKDIFVDYAKTLGLNLDDFKKDLGSDVIKSKVESQAKGGTQAGLNSTPTFIFNGKRIQPQNYEEFSNLIP
ncbi:MAG: thioredoxin domain-containing protein [bacterium]|nr:thioredoxin domain-containing protein [bacterium]